MTSLVYQQLAYHLDHLPGGFPSTESGVEIRILKRLFTPEEAQLALHLTIIPEPVRVIAHRAKIPIPIARKKLKELAGKGCILSATQDAVIEDVMPAVPVWIKRKVLLGNIARDETMLYAACNFVIGIWEFHLNDLTPELIKDVNEYMPHLMDDWIKYPQLRTIPINTSINPELKTFSYENARKIIEKQDRIAIANCICRVENNMSGHTCKHPLETCFLFGIAADYYERNKLGRFIDKTEALQILDKVEKSGLVLQPSNYQQVMNICCCCGCCCGVLRNIKQLPMSAQYIPSAFVNTLDLETCNGCGICAKRCPMEALSVQRKKAVLDTSRCIGCGVCVPTCPTQSLQLTRKPENEQSRPQKDMITASVKLSRARGKFNLLDTAVLMFQSWLDRSIAK